MHTKNSELDFAVELTISLLADIAAYNEADLTRDVQEVRQRVTSEGWAFLTKVLPALGKRFDYALSHDDGVMDYTGFKTRGGYPLFLGVLFRRIFTHEGKSLRDVDPVVVKHIRQILYQWYKYELPYTPEQEAALESRFEVTDASLPDTVPDCPVIQGARDIVARVVADVCLSACVPRHGPGAVATREQAWEKWRFKRLYLPIERYFPFSEWYIPCLSYLARSKDPLGHLKVLREGTARAVFVPKDSRGPRLISCEPLEYQWIQQGLAGELVYCINKHEFTSGRVNFTHQSVNRRFALRGSLGQRWVTLDMADASDRVSVQLVCALFANTHVLEPLLCARTQCTVLPSGRRVRMKKFAPMGSALCFPVESLVFFALAVSVLIHHCGRSLEEALKTVKVYGDDLILSFEDYEAVVQYFPYVGLMFNKSKCCTGGLFRESCGMDAFSGVDVTPIKFRTRFSRRREAASLASWVEYSNMLDLVGYFGAARVVEREMWKRFHYESGEIPYVEHSHPAVACLVFRRHDALLHAAPKKSLTRWNNQFQRSEFRGLCIQGTSVKKSLAGYERLFANLASGLAPRRCSPKRNVFESEISHSSFPLRVAVDVNTFPVRRQVTLTRRWCAFRRS